MHYCLGMLTFLLAIFCLTHLVEGTENKDSGLQSNVTGCHGNKKVKHPSDCKKYFYCKGIGKGIEKECADNENFDPDFEMCVWNQIYKCEDRNICNSLKDGTYLNPEKCDSFVKCIGGVAYNQACPKGLWYNAIKESCDHPYNVDCKAYKRTLTTSFINPRDKNQISLDYCKDKINGNYPNPHSCHSYITCSEGLIFENKCPTGLLFDPNTKICIWSKNVKCEGTSSLNICEGKHNGTFPNPEACNSYIVCRGGLKYQIECPKPLWFNKDKKQCDFPENVKCEAIRTGASNDTKSDFKDSQEIVNSFKDMTFTETTPLTKTNYYVKTSKKFLTQTLEVTPAVLQTFCSSKAPGNYAHPGRCDGFITCTGISYVVQSCPSGLWFNETQNVCDYPINVHCISWLSKISTTLITETLPSLPSNICVGKKLGNYAHPNSCSVFITCTGVRSQIQSCPRGLWFNEQQNICDYPKNVNCILSTPSFSCFGKIPGSYPAEKCNEYYICTGDELPLKKQCPLHTNFFPKSGMCVLSYSYSCEDPTFCVNQLNGMFANPFNCYGYYECINGRTIPRNCDYGLRFNGVSCVDASLYVCQ
ncbi:chondroitin proteoglycan 2 isoform X4 [Hydra vulgaris]|uniref:Chondroitin proteoglycan 2 isoform X4 n=1 Tax=Hydra vulgaris TaxID=6087 RepID=A0ABM4BFG8_HYDVU